MESNATEAEQKPACVHIGPLPCFFSGALCSGLYGTYCSVHSVQSDIFIACSLPV